MKPILALILLLTAFAVWAQMPASTPQPAMAPPSNHSVDNSMQEMIPPGLIHFEGVDVSQVLDVYAQLVGRTLLRATLPQVQIVFKTETPLTKADAIQALQAVLALNGIAVINIGDKFVKVVPTEQAGTAGEQFNDQNPNQLPELGSFVTRIVQLRYVRPSEMLPIILPFARSPNAILPIDSNGILVLRDYAENIKRMMEMIDQVDVTVPEEYISRVIPIKYAMADDIAGVLNSLESPGGGAVPFGAATTPNMSNAGNGLSHNNTTGNTGNNSTNPQNSQGSTGQSQLQSILNRMQNGSSAANAVVRQQPIQILGQTKIIADERSNSLLVYATRQDMNTITNIVAKLDVPLAQVLIESVIMEVDLNKSWSYGVSAAQNQINAGNVETLGAINNGAPFYNFLSSATTNAWPGNFTSGALSGLSYFANIGSNWDLALSAAASDSTTHIIQRPRIQTSQAREAQFFVGESVPYVTSVYYDSAVTGGASSSYSQLQVGISLDVTPFINPDGLVVMDINQQINDIANYTTITGVGNVPNTDNRTFTSEVAVKDRDTIVLGGFTDTEADKSSTGIPILQDIPLIGNLFKSPSSKKTRQELMVLMRPTVLRTPEAASIQAVREQARSPGIIGAERDERKVVDQERKAEAAHEKDGAVQVEPANDHSDPMIFTNQMGNPSIP